MVLFVSQTKKFAFKKIYFMGKELPCIRNPEEQPPTLRPATLLKRDSNTGAAL